MPALSLFFAERGVNLTSFFSLSYLLSFLPLSLIIYALVPQKAKKYCLLLESYAFFWLISGKLIVYLILSTLTVHYFGLWLDRISGQQVKAIEGLDKEAKKAIKKTFASKRKRVVLFTASLHIGFLLILKYTGFMATNINLVLGKIGVTSALEIPNYLLPIGISFFTMQAVSYILDVYNGVTKADENLLRLALFMSFFPQIVEGPICRYNQTAEALWNVKQIEYNNLTMGLQRILYGLMKKWVVADRLNMIVREAFADATVYEGGILAIAGICYTVQLYMDFSGTMDAVIGTAQIFGVKMPENFARPFFSKTISEFWTRWHITLGTWFRDYLFYPLTSTDRLKKLTSKARKKIGNFYGPLLAGSIALFCVWFCNGLWHGSAWQFIFFGLYHFVLILTGSLIAPPVAWLNKKLHINPNWFWYKGFQMIRTVFLVIIGEIIFRADGFKAAVITLKKIFTEFTFKTINTDATKLIKFDKYDIIITVVALLIVLTVSILNEKGIVIREVLAKRNIVVRWVCIYLFILFIVIFGAYGFGYVPLDPIYAQF